MIKETEVKIKIVGRTINKYKKLEYECNVGDEINIKIEELNKSSHVEITAICDICESERKLSYYAYNKNYDKYDFYACNKCKQIKIEKTNELLYGVKRPLQNKIIREKLEKTNNDKYGFDCASKNKQVIDKIIKTHFERYGDISSKTTIIKNKSKETVEKKLLLKYNYLNIQSINNNMCVFLCENGHNFDISFSNLHNRLKYDVTLCTKCNPINNHISDKESRLLNFIKDNYDGQIITSDRKILNGKELDIYLPESNLAFEFNGLYWHSELHKDKNYHQSKTKLCNKQNIDLFHIYEDDWNNRQEIIKSMILNRLNLTKNKIFGRKTQIREIKSKEASVFYENNHLQGKSSYSINIGLFYENEVVSLMSFKKRNNNTMELVRFANKLNTNVIGSASKLLKYFQKSNTEQKIVSFSNNDYSNGKLYKTLNFKIENDLRPDYSYILDNKRNHKFSYRKINLQKMGFDIENKTEHEICLENKIYRIYDSGKIKWTLNR